MKPKILVMGENLNYYEIQIGKEAICKAISEMSTVFEVGKREKNYWTV